MLIHHHMPALNAIFLYNSGMTIKQIKNQPYAPEKCWVGDQQKICYKTREEAEVAAKVAQYDHGAPELTVYKCEYGDHYHLSSKS